MCSKCVPLRPHIVYNVPEDYWACWWTKDTKNDVIFSRNSEIFVGGLSALKTGYFNMLHLEPWDPGNRKATGMEFHEKLGNLQSDVAEVTPQRCGL